MQLIGALNQGQLDIIGDVHGEYEALLSLMIEMDYDIDGNHPDNRTIIFVGDLTDRGPNSPAVLRLVKKLVRTGKAQAVLGNHELNLINSAPKSGSGWFFSERESLDTTFQPFEKILENEKGEIIEFLNSLPVALERNDLRIVHAAWHDESIRQLRNFDCLSVPNLYDLIEHKVKENIKHSGAREKYNEEQVKWGPILEDNTFKPPFLSATADYMTAHQMGNCIRVVTSGIERPAKAPFYAGGKWRFVERAPWWSHYIEYPAVICGHYWRRFNENEITDTNELDLFAGTHPTEWHGEKNNVFCIDFSVGARFKERKLGGNKFVNTKLAGLRWPERELIFDDGLRALTKAYRQPQPIQAPLNIKSLKI